MRIKDIIEKLEEDLKIDKPYLKDTYIRKLILWIMDNLEED